jgi:hypothetical protein
MIMRLLFEVPRLVKVERMKWQTRLSTRLGIIISRGSRNIETNLLRSGILRDWVVVGYGWGIRKAESEEDERVI